MKKILIYRDEGAKPSCVALLVSALKDEKIDQTFSLEWANKELFQGTDWQKNTHLIIFPGGEDIPYHQALKGIGNQNIKDFIHAGGNFLGICAGGYYGSAVVEFEKGGPLEVLATRELKFFPGTASGPAYGLGKFCYDSTEGGQIAKLKLIDSNPSAVAAYYYGGCAFVNAETYAGTTVLARYSDIKNEPAAIIKCQVGSGCAILSGVHPEYSANHKITEKFIGQALFSELKKVEKERRSLFVNLLRHLDLI